MQALNVIRLAQKSQAECELRDLKAVYQSLLEVLDDRMHKQCGTCQRWQVWSKSYYCEPCGLDLCEQCANPEHTEHLHKCKVCQRILPNLLLEYCQLCRATY
jgi:hypothetical protein